MKAHKAMFTKMYDMRIHQGLSHLQAVSTAFKEMDHEYKTTNGKVVFDQIDKISERVNTTGQDKFTRIFKTKEWNPDLKPRYFKL